LHLSALAAAKVRLSFSATNRRVYNLTVGETIDIGTLRWEGDAAAAFTITSSAAAEVDCTVDYETEVSPS
jgi:hypothetical protein